MQKPSDQIEKLAGEMKKKLILSANVEKPDIRMSPTEMQIINLNCMLEAVLQFIDQAWEERNRE
jgi:hypothetical protein